MQFKPFFRLAMTSILLLNFLFPVPFGFGIKTSQAQTQTQQLVESIDFSGNRRFSDENLLYYIQTRPGDPFSATQIERDLQAILALNAFEKTASRVLTEEGVRGGVNIIFEVRELPIIRDLEFKGAKAVSEADILKAFRENRIGISKEANYDPVKSRNGVRVIRELFAAKGYPNAKVEVIAEEVSATSTAITFDIEQGERSRIAKIDFEGNERFKDGELRGQLKLTKETGIFNLSRFVGTDILEQRRLNYDLNKNVLDYVRSKGYFNARFGEPEVTSLGRRRTGFFIPLPLISSKDDTLKVTVPFSEGKVYRVGDVKIEGNSIFSEQQIQGLLGLKKGEIANGKQIQEALYENLKKLYGSQGFIQYAPELDPNTRDNPANPNEGIVDFNIRIDEGKQFVLRRLEFTGNTFTQDRVLRREILFNEGDVYNQQAFEISTVRLNQLGIFDPIDKDKDAEFRTLEETGEVDLNLRVKERGRQQISFNGTVGGLGGAGFGLDYSTNNLLGRGEIFSFQVGLGNRQSSFQLSITEPYFRDRPISVGVSLFAFRRKFFGEGTFLSQNAEAQQGATTQLGFLTTDESNLFTQNTYGASVFASAPLSEFYRKRRFTQFSRIALAYQYTITSIKDPAVNASGNASTFIPEVFSQPNISTSRITPTFVYDSRQFSGSGIDPSGGSQLTVAVGLAGLGGDVRTYQPSAQYISFTPIRRKKSSNPEVFGFRLLAGTIGSFGQTEAIRNANSLSFINGVPINERYFIGGETSVRGYNVASGPLAPIDSFVTSRNLVVASNIVGTIAPVAATAGSTFARGIAESAQLGVFTGAGGANSRRLSDTQFQYIGADTQLLGNFEYRIPLFGPVSAALYADIGTAFNLRKGATQNITSAFLPDQPFLGGNTLSALLLSSNNGQIFQPTFNGGLILDSQGRFLTREAFQTLVDSGTRLDGRGIPIAPGLQEVFLRGEAQSNTQVRVADTVFGKFNDIRSSFGGELRVQVPVVNVPFRLIYAYNPNARYGFFSEAPGIFFNEKRNVFRFSVGRTF